MARTQDFDIDAGRRDGVTPLGALATMGRWSRLIWLRGADVITAARCD